MIVQIINETVLSTLIILPSLSQKSENRSHDTAKKIYPEHMQRRGWKLGFFLTAFESIKSGYNNHVQCSTPGISQTENF